jgi:hypothetical protein
MTIDYLEFDDKTSLGENKVGSNLISEMRSGAMKYRKWFSSKYKQSRKSNYDVDEIFQDKSFLENRETKLSVNEIQGVKVFKKFLQETFKTKGKEGFKAVLVK